MDKTLLDSSGHFTIPATFSVALKAYIDNTSYQRNCNVQNQKI